MSCNVTGSHTPSADPFILGLEAWSIISTRTRNCLGYRRFEDDPASTVAKVPIEVMRLSHLSQLGAADLLRLPNLGYACYCEVALAMDRYGWRLCDRWASESPLGYFHPSTRVRYVERAERAAEARRATFVRGETMRRLREDEGLTLQEIGNRFNVTGTAADTAIRHVRDIHALRAIFPLPSPVSH